MTSVRAGLTLATAIAVAEEIMPWLGRILIVAGLCAAGLLVVLIVASLQQVAGEPEPPPLVTEMPRHNAPLSDAEIGRCAECHADACRQFFETPHMRTLAPAAREDMLARFLGPDGEGRAVDASVPTFQYRRRGGVLGAVSSRSDSAVRVDWIFGSGAHAQTPVALSMLPDRPIEGLELHLSWYPGVGLSRTFGHQEEVGPGLASLGKPEDQATLVDCFGCHTTGLAVAADGRPDMTSFLPGVRCDKCHEDSRRHLESGGETAMVAWSDRTPIESIEACGECHRTTASSVVHEFAADDAQLTRFAPIGLSRSACFLQQGARRFDCTTCHDPHQPPPASDAFYVAKCNDCHSSVTAACSAQPPTSNCLPCHMPKRKADLHLAFTDHWIRIFESSESGGAPIHTEQRTPPVVPVEAAKPTE